MDHPVIDHAAVDQPGVDQPVVDHRVLNHAATEPTGRRWQGPLLAGLGAWLFVPVVGRVSLTEIAAVVLAPCCVLALMRLRGGRAVALTGLLWTIGVVIGQVAHPADSPTLAKALASAVVLTLTVGLVCGVLAPGRNSTWSASARRTLVVGFAVGEAIGMVLTPPTDAGVDPWKFGVGQSLTLLAVVLTERLRPPLRRPVTAIVLFGSAGIDLALGARSLCLFAVLIGVATVLAGDRPRGGAWLVWFAGLAVAGALTVGMVYTDLAQTGRLGPAEQEKISFQTGDFGIAVGGRKDVVFLIAGVLRNPVVGWGPGAVVPADVKADAVVWLQEHGYSVYGYDLITFVLPPTLYLHSVLLGGWATDGLLGLLFWLLAAVLLARGLLAALRARAMAESYLVLVACWHVLFSPLGDVTRGHIAVALALSVTSLRRPVVQSHEQHQGGAGGTHGVAERCAGGRIGGHEGGTDGHPAQAEHDADRKHHADGGFIAPRL